MIDVSPELLAFLREEYDRCKDTTLEDERETAIDRYNGQPYGDEEEGQSQVVARDTAETVDYMVISILRTLVSGDDVVEFQHSNAELAHQATQTIRHIFMDEQDGYTVLHDWLKAGLLEKNAVAMTYGEPQPAKRELLQGVSPMALPMIEQQGMKVIEAEQAGADENGEPIFTIAVLKDQPPKFCDAAVPNEEFYCSPDARNLTEAALKGRRVRKTVSELVEMGHDADELESAGNLYSDSLSLSRDENRSYALGERTGPQRVLWWHEEYARFDANGDGIAELLYIQRTDDMKVFAIEEMEDADDHPYVDWCPFPMQHRRIGQSLADKVMDIERIRTVLLRQSLNGIYTANNPSTYLHEDAIGETTVEDLLTVRPGRIIRWRGAVPPVERSGTFDPSSGFTMLEYMNGERESRTGITRLNQGLDADTLNKTATGTALMQAQGQQMEEYLARNFANGVAKLFTKKARLLKRHGKPITVPIDGEFVEVDPSQWPEDMLARPRVGLGSGRKDQRVQYRRELLEMMAMGMQSGTSIFSEKNLYNAVKGYIADVDLGDADEFLTDPEQQGPQEPQPDPEMMKLQAEMSIKQAELEMKGAQAQSQMQLKLMEIEGKLALAREDMQARAVLERQKAFVETQLAQQQAMLEAQLERFKIAQQAQASERDNARRDAESGARIKNMRKGGSLAK